MSVSLKTMRSFSSNRKPQSYFRQAKKLKIIGDSSFQKPTIQQILQTYQSKKEHFKKLQNIFSRNIKNTKPSFYSNKPSQISKDTQIELMNSSYQTIQNKTKHAGFRQTITYSCQKNLEKFNRVKANLKASKNKLRIKVNRSGQSNYNISNVSNGFQIQWFSKLNQLSRQRYKSEKMFPVLQSKKITANQRINKTSNTKIKIKDVIQNSNLLNLDQQKAKKRYADIQIHQLMYDDQKSKISQYSPETKRKILTMQNRTKTQFAPIVQAGWRVEQQHTFHF